MAQLMDAVLGERRRSTVTEVQATPSTLASARPFGRASIKGEVRDDSRPSSAENSFNKRKTSSVKKRPSVGPRKQSRATFMEAVGSSFTMKRGPSPAEAAHAPTLKPTRNPRMDVAAASEALTNACHEASWDEVCLLMHRLEAVFKAASVAAIATTPPRNDSRGRRRAVGTSPLASIPSSTLAPGAGPDSAERRRGSCQENAARWQAALGRASAGRSSMCSVEGASDDGSAPSALSSRRDEAAAPAGEPSPGRAGLKRLSMRVIAGLRSRPDWMPSGGEGGGDGGGDGEGGSEGGSCGSAGSPSGDAGGAEQNGGGEGSLEKPPQRRNSARQLSHLPGHASFAGNLATALTTEAAQAAQAAQPPQAASAAAASSSSNSASPETDEAQRRRKTTKERMVEILGGGSSGGGGGGGGSGEAGPSREGLGTPGSSEGAASPRAGDGGATAHQQQQARRRKTTKERLVERQSTREGGARLAERRGSVGLTALKTAAAALASGSAAAGSPRQWADGSPASSKKGGAAGGGGGADGSPPLLERWSQLSLESVDSSSARRYDPQTSKISGFLIDLDGTLYEPGGLLPGAKDFYAWLRRTNTPFVLLSNTGAKNSLAVQQKLSSPPYAIDDEVAVPLDHIHTASEAQADLLLDRVPEGARLLVVSGGGGVWREDLRTRRGEAGAALVATWEVRTTITEAEAKRWASHARDHKEGVWVAFFNDGGLGGIEDPSTGEVGFSDWSFEVIKRAGLLLAHGAQFVYTADDAFNPSTDPEHPGMVFPLPGPGMFAEMMKKLMYPRGRNSAWCAGKGGNVGAKYMMRNAIAMLRAQGHSGELDEIMMVGDRFDTDVRGGLSVGIQTCLVLTGCHSMGYEMFYRADPTSFFANSVGELPPLRTQQTRPPDLT